MQHSFFPEQLAKLFRQGLFSIYDFGFFFDFEMYYLSGLQKDSALSKCI
jgi:hypothetical protein